MDDFSMHFNSEEEFNNVLGLTSYYQAMQDYISKLVKGLKPDYLLEFGCGSGETIIRLAKENPQASLVGVDIRENILNFAGEKKEIRKIKNLTLVLGDLNLLDNYNLKNVDIVLLVYSFAYINDPVEEKIKFLKNLYSKMHSGSYLVIGDWFLNDAKSNDEDGIKQVYNNRILEGERSIYWNFLNEKEVFNVENAEENAKKYSKHHKRMLKQILLRDGVYPVSKQWLIDVVVQTGYRLLLENFINNDNDAIVVFKK